MILKAKSVEFQDRTKVDILAYIQSFPQEKVKLELTANALGISNTISDDYLVIDLPDADVAKQLTDYLVANGVKL